MGWALANFRPQTCKVTESLLSFLTQLTLVFVGVRLRGSGGSQSRSDAQVWGPRGMVRGDVTGSLSGYGPQTKFVSELRPCFVKPSFFPAERDT